MLRVGVTELNIGFENREEAKKCCLEVMEEASANGVELLVFPEMTLTGFTMLPWLYAESWDADNIPDSVSFLWRTAENIRCRWHLGIFVRLWQIATRWMMKRKNRFMRTGWCLWMEKKWYLIMRRSIHFHIAVRIRYIGQEKNLYRHR